MVIVLEVEIIMITRIILRAIITIDILMGIVVIIIVIIYVSVQQEDTLNHFRIQISS